MKTKKQIAKEVERSLGHSWGYMTREQQKDAVNKIWNAYKSGYDAGKNKAKGQSNGH